MRREDREHAGTRLVLTIGLVALSGLAGCGPGPKKTGAKNEYVFFPPPPDIPRVQFLCHLHGSVDFASKPDALAEFLLGKDTERYKTIVKPFGVAVRDGRIFVADTMDASIAVIDVPKQRYSVFGKEGRGKLVKPINIRMDQSGRSDRLYVTDTVRGQIVVFDLQGKYVGEYGDGKEFRPADVIVDGDELFVLDIAAHNIKVYDLKTRKLKRTLGRRGPGFGEYNYPTNMVMNAQGYIEVCDSMNIRVQRIDREGKAVFQFGQAGRTPGHFARPRGIAVDRDGLIYVADAVLGVVQLFNPEGQPLMHLGEMGKGEGRLYLPAQVTANYDSLEHFRKYLAPGFDAKYLIFVTNQLGPNKVSVFAFGRGKLPPGAKRGPASRPTSRAAPTTRPS